jgi:tetratricopeptide (TPR) repeat protein
MRAAYLSCLLAMLSLPAAWAQDPAARIIAVQGAAEVFRHTPGTWEPAQARQVLFAGDAIRTGTFGRVTAAMADESLVQIRSDTHFVLKEVAQEAGWITLRTVSAAAARSARSVYALLYGETWLRNKNRQSGVFIETPVVTTGIRGTEFDIRVDRDKGTYITVLEGVVAATNRFGEIEGSAGEQIIAEPGLPPRKQVLVTPEDAVQWTLSLPYFFRFSDFPLTGGEPAALREELAQLESGGNATALRRAQILRDLGRAEEAAVLLEGVLATDPANTAAAVTLGWCWLDRGDAQAALRHLGTDDSEQAYLGRTAAQATLQRLSDARTEVANGLARHPGSVPLATQRALIDMLAGDYLAANASLAEITARHPEAAVAWRYLALNAVILGKTEEALSAAERAVALASESPVAHIVHGDALQAAFDLEAAERALRQALALDASNPTALVNLAQIEFGDDRLEAARATIERAAAAGGPDPEIASLRGFILLAGRDVQAAIAAFDLALKSDPAQAEAWMGRGLAFMRQGDVASAMESIASAAALDPRRSLYMSYWGKMLYQIRRFDRALDVLARAAQLDPRDPTPPFYTAIILRDLNRPAEAIRMMNRALALNDNRAVYRSRFLLDQDMAVRNVDLSILYDRLGLNAWAQAKAVDALKADYLNYNAHLSFAGALAAREDRAFPFFNEQLLARLLQPANVNTFNSFNEYTSFFERPSLDAIATARAGNHDQKAADVIAFGNLPDWNLAWQAGAFYDSTDGWRDSNFERFTDIAAIAKWQPTPKDGVMVAVSTLDSKQGDEPFRRFEHSSPADPIERQAVDQTRVEVGYHHHFAANTDLIGYFAYLDQEVQVFDHGFEQVFPTPTAIVDLETRADVNQDQPLYQGQLQLTHRRGDHQLIAGTLHTFQDIDAELRGTTTLTLSVPSLNFTTSITATATDAGSESIDFHSYYLQDIWRPHRTLTLEAAIYSDHFEGANPFSGIRWQIDEIDPRLGVIWQFRSRDRLRLAAFRYLLPFTPARTDPSDVAGVPIFRNVDEGARITEFDVVWEHEWDSGFLAANAFRILKELQDDVADAGGGERRRVRKGDTNGIEIEVNQLLGDHLAAAAQYRFLDVEDRSFPPGIAELLPFENPLPETDRQEQSLTAALRWVYPSGFSGGLRHTFRAIDLRAGRADEHIHVTDFDLNYELPAKRGNLSLRANNLFDEKFDWVSDRFILTGRRPAREVLGTVSINF